jgi:hypothetical protein
VSRALLAGLLLATGALSAACSGSAPAVGPVHRGANLVATPASAFVDSVGVNVHLGYTTTAYRNTTGVFDRLVELGVHHVRDSLPLRPNTSLLAGLRALPARGIKADLAVGQSNERRLPDPAAVMGSLQRTGARGAVDAVEAPNEWDQHGGAGWVSEIVGFTRSFGTLLHADPAWGSAVYVGPSTGRASRVNDLPDLGTGRGDIDAANLHIYAAGGPPENGAHYVDDARRMAPGKPLYVTEMGFHTAVNQDGKQPAVTEAQQGSYLARQLLENYTRGVARSYIYELVDERPDPGLTNQERHFGLLRPDLTPKPAYELLRTLLSDLRDPPSAADTLTSQSNKPPPAPLQVQLQTSGNAVGSLLLRRSDGSYRLVLWARGGLHLDGTSRARDAAVHVKLTGAARQIRVVRTSGGAIGGTPSAIVSDFTGRLGGDPVILDISANAAQEAGAGDVKGRTAAFDASGVAPGVAAVPHGNVGQLPSRVKNALIWGSALLTLGVAVTMGTWARRRGRRRQKRK